MLLAAFYAARHNLCFSIICKPGLGCPCPVSYLRGLALHCLFPSISGWMSGALSHTLCVPRYLFASSFLCFLYPSAHSSFPCRTKDSYWFSPSPKKNFQLLWPLLTSVRSALSHNNVYSFRSIPYRPPWVPHISFPPSICRIYCTWFRVAIGLHLVRQTYPHVQPSMRFLFVRPEVCPWVSKFPTSGFLQIPPHDGHPYLRLYPSRYRADLELAPLRNVRRQAHRYNVGKRT